MTLSRQTTIDDGLETNINTFVGHNLLVLQVAEEKGGTPLGSSSHSPNVHVRGDEVRKSTKNLSIFFHVNLSCIND